MRVPSTHHRDIPVFEGLVCQLPLCCGCHGAIAGSSLAYASHAGTRREKAELVTSGGRVLAVTALGETVTVARARAYEAVAQIDFEGRHFRRDIALSAADDKIGGD